MEQQQSGPIPEPVRSAYLANDAEALVASTLATRDERGLDEGLDRVAVEVLVYCGSRDAGHELAMRSAEEMPHAEFVSLDGLDHMQAMQQVGAALPHISRFLARVTDR